MRKFHRKTGQRRLFYQGLANNLIMKEKIATTEIRAKAIRPFVEKLVTIGKKQQLASLRLLMSRLPKEAAQKVYYEIATRYQDRKGGYLRIIKQGRVRKRDGTRTAIIEFV